MAYSLIFATFKNIYRMRIIVKPFIVIIFLLAFAINVQAQDNNEGKLSMYVHGTFGVPLDKSTTNAYTGAFGVQTGVLYRVANMTHIGGMTGYSNFPGKTGNILGSLYYIPVKASVRQYLPILNNKVFGQANVGAAFIGLPDADASDTKFGFDLYGGMQFLGNFEAAIGFDAFQEIVDKKGWTSQFMLKIGYRFGLN